ncbi:hypothetical protein BJ981_005042 [Sphaerisporangium krabiense]|uniref:Uncharacterized protein n=1 Tax=Sphaerisporangium krabiense TaxID=763782 RepID=A0A7W8Z8E8_9ACTN|nr:hypothetical protein [Sphaerisporangium krabiense]
MRAGARVSVICAGPGRAAVTAKFRDAGRERYGRAGNEGPPGKGSA